MFCFLKIVLSRKCNTRTKNYCGENNKSPPTQKELIEFLSINVIRREPENRKWEGWCIVEEQEYTTGQGTYEIDDF